MTRARLADRYLVAKEVVEKRGFGWEIDWQDERSTITLCESDLLREIAWVILSSGMRESVVRSKFPAVSRAFFQWRSASMIASERTNCERDATTAFNHVGKISAIITAAEFISVNGFEATMEATREQGIEFLMQFPYLGPATARHLAKNLGFDTAKPDRHLQRVASQTGYKDSQNLCLAIARELGEKISVIDVVIWRYATLESSYLKLFAS